MIHPETRIKSLEWTVAHLRKKLEEAEERGYRRGVKDAADIADHDPLIRDAILALLQQTGSKADD